MYGAFLGLSLIKLGNPVILDRMVQSPGSLMELVFNSWPVSWGYWALAASLLIAIPSIRSRGKPRSRGNLALATILLPIMWLGWQIVAASQSIEPRLSSPTVVHFGCCVLSFYLGWSALSHGAPVKWFWLLMLLSFAWVLWIGFGQHFGGLEQTRRMMAEGSDWQQLPPEYVKRIQSGRIFSTFIYPNALAGAVLLLLPALTAFVWTRTRRLSNIPRGILTGLLVYSGLACLVWSGSKSGWLIGLVIGTAILLRLGIGRKAKWLAVAALLLVGVGWLLTRHHDYFHRGATSVGARFDYWNAAWRIAEANPVFGTGPGTFSVPYGKLKQPESEMTRLVHNDFLEQASDSGWMGFLLYFAFTVMSLALLYPKVSGDTLLFGVWLGTLGFALQGMVEFGLYIPALAWTGFSFLGWLWAAPPPNGFDMAQTDP